jgi:hypothetical protein
VLVHKGHEPLCLRRGEVDVIVDAFLTGDADGEASGASAENGLALGKRVQRVGSSEFRHAGHIRNWAPRRHIIVRATYRSGADERLSNLPWHRLPAPCRNAWNFVLYPKRIRARKALRRHNSSPSLIVEILC